MSKNKTRRVGVINFVGQMEIPADAVEVSVKPNITNIGRHLLVNLKGVRDLPIPPSALVSVEIKDNILNEPTNHVFSAWHDIDRSLAVRVPINDGFYARRTTIKILFIDPSNGCIVAATPRLHASDDTGKLKNSGESYIKFRREAINTLPAKPCVEIEGPVIELGSNGPADVAASENDIGFVQYGLPAAIRQFVCSMLLAEDGYNNQRWNTFKRDAAEWAGFSGDWADMLKKFQSADKPEIALEQFANAAVAGLMNSRAYKEKLKVLIKQFNASHPSITEEYENAA